MNVSTINKRKEGKKQTHQGTDAQTGQKTISAIQNVIGLPPFQFNLEVPFWWSLDTFEPVVELWW